MPTGTEQPRVRVVGFLWSPASHEVKDYLARSRVDYHWVDVDRSPEGRRLMEEHGARAADLPLVVFPDGSHLLRPSDQEIAEKIGLSTEAEAPFYELVVVGGGPAGFAAAIYGASEGVRTLVVEREAAGGQAGMSAGIENYFGFPEGLTGAELARRSMEQAERFGVEVVVARAVTRLREDGAYRVLHLDDGDEIYSHTVLLATGVSWRVLEAPGCRGLIGRGVYYGAAGAEAATCAEQDVYLVGGGNSAGQAAMLLARYARSVTLVAPEPDFAERMSEYLYARLHETPNVRFRPAAQVVEAAGDGRLTSVTIEEVESGARETVPTSALFVFIGARPDTDWLDGVVERDEDGFVRSGSGLQSWRQEREPHPLETSLPGVFVAGDVRAGSVKRIGAAVGEGSAVIQSIHTYLRER